MFVIVVDDERTFASDATIRHCRTVGEALALLVKIWNFHVMYGDYGVDEIWLDHDLGEGGDIKDVVNWLVNVAVLDKPFPVGKIYVHSQNPVGADIIVRSLHYYYDVKRSLLPELV